MLTQSRLFIAPVGASRRSKRRVHRLLAVFGSLADHAAISVVVVALPLLLGTVALHLA